MPVLKPQRDAERGVGGRWLPGVVPAGARPWQPGVSANPGGKGGLYQETLKLMREASPRAAQRMLEIAKIDKSQIEDDGSLSPLDLRTDDIRAVGVAATWCYERAWGKPKDYDPAKEGAERPPFDPSRYSADQLQAIKQHLLAVARLMQTTKDEASP